MVIPRVSFATTLAALLVLHSQLAACCNESHWERRLDADLAVFEDRGIHTVDLSLAADQVCGGYVVSIFKNELYALPLGWEAEPRLVEERLRNPHDFLKMFTNVLCEYEVPDVTFVLNAYDNLCMETSRTPVPVFSWGKDIMNDDYQILVPYAMVFLGLNNTVRDIGAGVPWDQKRDVAIWRGSTTGGTFTKHTWQYYPRAQLVQACNNSDLCDAKFTGYPQSHKPAEDAIKASGGHGNNLNITEILKHKYVIVNDGNMAPSSRLSTYLHAGSLLFKQESPSIEFYYDDLKPYVHYVPLSYFFGDVKHKVMWARQHDIKVKAIVANARKYAQTYFTAYNLNCYMYRLFSRYHRVQRFTPGFYNESFAHVKKPCSTS